MKTAILLITFTLSVYATAAQQKLTIINQDYELAKRTAVQQKKLLIVDFYTTWCVPCKVLEKQIFQNDSMAEEISKNFIVLRYDAEKDSAYNLTLKHHVCSYPTNIILTADGKTIHKMYGTGENSSLKESYSKLLIESLELDRQDKYLNGYAATINPDLYPEFYKKYIRRVADIKPGDLNTYWSNYDLNSEAAFSVLAYFGEAPEWVVDSIIRNKDGFIGRFGEADVKFVLGRITGEKFSKAIERKDKNEYEKACAFATHQLSKEDASLYHTTYHLQMKVAMKEWDEAVNIVKEQTLAKTINGNGINYFCWTVYEKCDDKKIINEAVIMMGNVVAESPSFAVLDTYANLLSKSGKTAEAIVAMDRAIQLGKAHGEDTSESEKVIRELKRMKM